MGPDHPPGDADVLALGPHLEQRGPRHLSEPLAPRLSTLSAYNKILCLGPTLRVSFYWPWVGQALVFLFLNLINLFFKLIFYWSIVDLQCCVSFRCTAK